MTWTDGVNTWAGNPFCNRVIDPNVVTTCAGHSGPITALLCSTSPAIDAGALIAGFHCPLAGSALNQPLQPDGSYCAEWYGKAPDIGSCEFVPSVTPPPAQVVYVSDLPFAAQSINGWGPVELDMSNGEALPGDGHPITIRGAIYPKGLGAHAYSEIVIDLSGRYSTFLSDIGIDDEVGQNGSVVFQVWADGSLLADSGLVRGSDSVKQVSVSLLGKNQLKLIVADGGDGIDSDHADWANARLIPAVVSPPGAPSGLMLR